MRNGIWAVVTTLVLAFGALGCSGVCDGKDCVCASGTCEQTCEEPGCNMTCSNGATCKQVCPQGGCDLSCTGAASCEVECAGGGCNVACIGTPDCRITQCTGAGCDLSCGGAATCECGPDASCTTVP